MKRVNLIRNCIYIFMFAALLETLIDLKINNV